MKKISFGSSLLLFLAACIWGVAFVAQSVGMDYMGPCTFNGIRFLIGGTVLLPLVYVRVKKKKNTPEELPPALTLKGGICCGLAICAASLCQQIGIMETTVGKAGFITTLYIIIVPVFGLFLRKKVPGKVWIAAAVAAVGMYMLCINESFSVSRGDAFVFLCAIIFAVHILVIDYFSPKVDGVKMSCIQFFVCGIASLPFMFLLETPRVGAMLDGWMPLLYAGVLSCGVGYTLQIIGQKNVNPAIASLILSLESCFSVLAGWIVLGERLSIRESIGCVLMFTAIILAQLPEKRTKDLI